MRLRRGRIGREVAGGGSVQARRLARCPSPGALSILEAGSSIEEARSPVRASRSLTDANRTAVQEEARVRVESDRERSLHVGFFSETHESVATRETRGRIGHDFGGFRRREEWGEETLCDAPEMLSRQRQGDGEQGKRTMSSCSPTSLAKSPTKTLHSPSHFGALPGTPVPQLSLNVLPLRGINIGGDALKRARTREASADDGNVMKQ